jgi:hypothetical protein
LDKKNRRRFQSSENLIRLFHPLASNQTISIQRLLAPIEMLGEDDTISAATHCAPEARPSNGGL